MSLLSVVKDVCAVVGVAIPTSVLTNINVNRTMQEMFALANEMAQRIAYDNRDWTQLKSVCVMTGDGVQTAFALPADYQRMLLTSSVWRSDNNIDPMRFILDADEWLSRRNQNLSDPRGEWTMLGGNMVFAPALPPGVTASFAYLQKNCIALNSGGFGDTFANDLDSFVLGDRIHKLGMIWQWKANKGSPYQEDLSNFGDALTKVMGNNSPAPILIGRRSLSLAVKTAYPWPAPTGGP